MLKEIAVALVCAVLVLEGMVTLQLYGLNALSGVLAGATVGGLGLAFARIRHRAQGGGKRRRAKRAL